MVYNYDFHIHTAASPCGDEWMTPNNIVNMCLLKGLQIIAITDHQTCCNCEAVHKVGQEKGLIVIPGMEIECQEEFHLICLFKNIQSAQEMEAWLKGYMPPILNKPNIFGEQLIYSSEDEIIGKIDQLLLVAAQISCDYIVAKAHKLGAFIYPAHIDRQSYSILSNLGMIPKELGFTALEISYQAQKEIYQARYPGYKIFQSSDAHYLGHIAEKGHIIEEEFLIRNNIL